jgi:hypothetical protein
MGGEQLSWRNVREIERERDLRFLRCVIGKIEGCGDDMGTGKDLTCTHEEASAYDLSSSGTNTYKGCF